MTEDQFWQQVAMSPEGCWLWTAARSPKGYGVVRYDGKMWRANRVAWVLTNGPIPAGKLVCHRCDNPPCCNPAHLFLGTAADNHRDRSSKGRQAKGERHGCARLTRAQVEEVRHRHLGELQREVAAVMGIAQTTVSAIVCDKTWTDSEERNGGF